MGIFCWSIIDQVPEARLHGQVTPDLLVVLPIKNKEEEEIEEEEEEEDEEKEEEENQEDEEPTEEHNKFRPILSSN